MRVPPGLTVFLVPSDDLEAKGGLVSSCDLWPKGKQRKGRRVRIPF